MSGGGGNLSLKMFASQNCKCFLTFISFGWVVSWCVQGPQSITAEINEAESNTDGTRAATRQEEERRGGGGLQV